MSNTINAPAYYVCASEYHGTDEELLREGVGICITTAPIYREQDLAPSSTGWYAYQHGPFRSLKEAEIALARIYGPCDQVGSATDDPALAAVLVASYSPKG